MSLKVVIRKRHYECELCGKKFTNKQSFQGILSQFRCKICNKVICKKCNKGSPINRLCEPCLTKANSPELKKTARLNGIIEPISSKFFYLTIIAGIILLIGIFGKTDAGNILLVPSLLISIPIFVLQVILLIISKKIDKKQKDLIQKVK